MMAMPEPTPEEIATFTTLDLVADWADVPHRSSPDGDGSTSPRGTLFQALGANATTKPRSVAGIPKDEFDNIVATWKIGQMSPSPIARASAGLLGTACRLAAGTIKRKALVESEDLAAQLAQAEVQKLMLQAQIATANATASSSCTAAKKVKLSTVVDQSIDTEVELLSTNELATAYASYRTWYGDVPPPEEDVSKEQLAGLKALYTSGSAPYVDLAVWGPHALRLQKKLQMEGLVMGNDGKWRLTKLFGPPTYDQWLEGWTVFRTGSVMLAELTPATCDAYSRHIGQYAKTYGSQVWPLIYQADVRARVELLERVRRAGTLAADDAAKNGGSHPFQASKPWEWSFRAAVADNQFWKTELEQKALMVLNRLTSVSENLGGDAPIGRAATAAAIAMETDASEVEDDRDAADYSPPLSPPPPFYGDQA